MPNRELTKAIGAELVSVLSPRGFRKRNLTFMRKTDEIVQMITLQKSTSSTDVALKVTVNAGLWINELAPIRAGVPDKPEIWAAHWRTRIGELSPENQDLWWSVATEDEAAAVGAELARRIINYVLPEMERLSSREAVIDLWRSGAAPGLTATQRDRYLSKLLRGRSDG